jgi:hypothetical protein
MIRNILFCLCLFPLVLSAQKPIDLKKKFFGTYVGEISAFQLDSGKDLLEVDKTIIKVIIQEKTITFTIGKDAIEGTYVVLFEGKKYFLLDCIIENQLAGERIVVYKKGNKISRDGLYPQPNAFLYLKK